MFLEYNGHKFHKDMNTGYYRGWTGGDKPEYLHRYIWECEVGKIHDNCHIHHIDGNKDNNDISNLEEVDSFTHLSEHAKIHAENNREKMLEHLSNINDLAKAWHSSDEGHKWHSEHAKETFGNSPLVSKICEQCGKEYFVKKFVSKRSRFCSNACKSANRRNSGVDKVIRTCLVCGCEFSVSKFSGASTCSKKCASAMRFGKY